MKRRELIVATGAAATTALAGCVGTGDDGDATIGGGNGPGNARTITVSNTGEVTGDPDLAVLRLGVEATENDAQTVRDDLSERADALVDALIDAGVDEDAITTHRYRIREQIDRRRMEADGVEPTSREEAEEYIYYQGTHSFSVEVEDVDRVGEVIDTAVDAGADEVDRVTFTLSDEKRADLREDALREAVQNARSEADAIADEIGAEVVEATVVDASDGRITPVERDVPVAEDDAPARTPSPDSAPSTGMEPGDVTVTAEVHVRYTME